MDGTRKTRIGIYECSRNPSGPSRYVHSILSALDTAELEVMILEERGGPYQDGPGIKLVPRH